MKRDLTLVTGKYPRAEYFSHNIPAFSLNEFAEEIHCIDHDESEDNG